MLVCYKRVFRSQLLSKFLLDEGQIIHRSGGICGPASDRIDALKNPHFGLQVLDLIWLAILTVCRVSVWAEKASSGFIQEPICNHKPLQKLTATNVGPCLVTLGAFLGHPVCDPLGTQRWLGS